MTFRVAAGTKTTIFMMRLTTPFRILLAWCLLSCLPAGMRAQVSVEATIDSSLIFVGQQVGIRVEVSADKGAAVQMPQYDSLQQVVPGVEVVHADPIDTQYVNDGRRMVLSRRYIITSFDSALYYLPPMQVKVNGKPFETKSLALKVLTLDVDTLHADSIFGMKAEMAPPFAWEEYRTLLWLAVVTLLMTLALTYVAIRLKDNKPVIRRIKLKPRLAPHKVAMQKIERIKEDKIWQKDDSKEYYTALTDTLRQYINERYGFNAMEMTTHEIIEHLQAVNDEEAVRELKELFETADLVKFAKYNTLINENDRNLVNAIEYINSTKQEETAAPQPKEIVVVDRKSKSTKMMLGICLAAASVVLLAVVSYMVYRIVMLNL